MKSSKPAQVRFAIALFYLALLLALAQPFILSLTRPPVAAVLGYVTAGVLTVFLIEFISIGRNWARIVYLVFTILPLPISFLSFQTRLAHDPLAAASIVVQLLAHGVGLWLVFSAPGSGWFRARKG